MKFPDASGVPVNMLPRRDFSAFEQLKGIVDAEGRSLASEDGLGMLASIGLFKGMPFKPSAHDRAIIDRAAKTAYKMSRVVGLQETLDGGSLRVFPDRRWLNPLDTISEQNSLKVKDLSFRNTVNGYTALDSRIWFFTNYYSISPGMISRVPGKGASYMIAFNDASGAPLSGGASYRLRLPPNILVAHAL